MDYIHIKSSISSIAIAATVLLAVPSVAFAQSTDADKGGTVYVSSEDAVPGLVPAGAAATAVYLDGQGRKISGAGGTPKRVDSDEKSDGSSVAPAAIGCTPESGRDNPHYSSGDVSGHGWWRKGSCTAATATVYNCLYEYFTDNTWRQKKCSVKKVLRPYTGSGDRTNARVRCNPTNRQISWRNHVDVDVDGQVDTRLIPASSHTVRPTSSAMSRDSGLRKLNLVST